MATPDRFGVFNRNQIPPLQYDDLDSTNSPLDNYVPSYDEATGKFTWVSVAGGVSQLSDLSDVGVTTPTNKNILIADGNSWESRALVEADISDLKTTFGITIDGGGGVIETGIKGYIRIPYACTITKVTLLSDQSGSIVIDIWKDSYVNYPPTNADSITASTPPTLSSATKSEDSTLTAWTTSISAGDCIGFNVDSITIIEKVTLIVEITKT